MCDTVPRCGCGAASPERPKRRTARRRKAVGRFEVERLSVERFGVERLSVGGRGGSEGADRGELISGS